MKKPRWLVSSFFDIGLFVGPAVLSVILLSLLPGARTTGTDTPVWAWAVFVIGVDVAHVYASLYRTYFDREEFARRRELYVMTPMICYLVGVVLYGFGALVFWRVLAYLAVFHFVRQQYGFVMLYKHRMGEKSRLDNLIDRAAIYLAMIYPLAFWHGNLPRQFAWFIPGDFASFGAGWGPKIAAGCFGVAMSAFVVRQFWLLATGRQVNLGKVLVVLSTALSWYVGIVLFNSDFAFTVTNVLAHGIPYMALVWLYCWRRAPDRRPEAFLARIAQPKYIWGFVGLLVGIAWLEECVWDVMVYREHPTVFGNWPDWLWVAGSPGVVALLVPFLAVPQATHYVLDAYMWKFDGSNPGLKEALFKTPAAEPPARTPVLVA